MTNQETPTNRNRSVLGMIIGAARSIVRFPAARNPNLIHNAPVKRFSWIAFSVGCATMILVAGAIALGWLQNVELKSIDWRFQNVRFRAMPLSDQIALVVIDDNAIDTLGRWPWPRQRMAQAINEISRAGARTVALDLLLSEPDSQGAADDKLAAEIAGVNTVLGFDAGIQFKLGDEWKTPEGAIALTRLLEALSSHIDGNPAELATTAQLDGDRKAEFLEHPIWFKELAAWKVLWADVARSSLPPLEDLIFKLCGGNHAGQFAERMMIEQLWQRAQSWIEFNEELVLHGERTELIGGHDQEPPIPQLARAASGVGVVTNEQRQNDTDGDKRRTGVMWDVPGARAYQLGLVAAATHLGLKPNDIVVENENAFVGDVAIPIHDGIMVLDWPTSTFDGGFAQWSQPGLGGQERPAISIGALVGLSDDRVLQQGNERKLAEARAALAALVPAYAAPEVAQMSDGEFAALVSDADMDDAIPTAARETADQFLKLSEGVKLGAIDIAARAEELKSKLQGKLVFIGWTATGALADFVPTPCHQRTPGVFVHVVAADMVLNRHAREMAPEWMQWVAIFAFGILASFGAARLSTVWSAVSALILVVMWALTAGLFAFNELHIIMPLAGPIVVPVASWATGTAAMALLSARDRARITRQFSARVSPQLVERLANNPDALTMSGQERQITVMFGDLAGFTTIAEQLGGPEVVRTLNLYLGRLSEELVLRDAYVNKFLGDGFMAFWSAFGDDPRQESRAAESAVACQVAMKEIARDSELGSPNISVRLGIATGIAVVGDCGAPPKLNDYTAIGDVVNLAARLESANKQFGTSILIDGATRAGIVAQGGNASIRIRTLGAIVVVGQSKPIEIFEVCAADADLNWIAATEQAVALFRTRKASESTLAWRAFEQSYGASKLSKMYLDAMEAVAAGDEPDDGVLHLRAK